MIINHNLPAFNTHRNMGLNNAAASKNMEKLSSGLKINRAADDAAGLSISEKCVVKSAVWNKHNVTFKTVSHSLKQLKVQ